MSVILHPSYHASAFIAILGRILDGSVEGTVIDDERRRIVNTGDKAASIYPIAITGNDCRIAPTVLDGAAAVPRRDERGKAGRAESCGGDASTDSQVLDGCSIYFIE